MHFNLEAIRILAEHRTPVLTAIFTFFTFLGDTNGYILVITGIYVAWDKRLALRLAVVILLSSILNHLLKVTIRNPRPFVTDGTYLKEWAVPKSSAVTLAADYSTPSDHAMGAASFYPCLAFWEKKPAVTGLSIVAVVMIGLSRPYLGVHYFEDVFIGWSIGLVVAIIAAKYVETLSNVWRSVSYANRIVSAVVGSIVFCLISIALGRWKIDSQPETYSEYAGYLTGIVVAIPLEARFVNFHPQSSGVWQKIARFVLSVVMVIATTALLGAAVHKISGNDLPLTYMLDYVRYLLAGVVSIFLAPWVFTKLCLCKAAHLNLH